jgi:hypothetical protein
MGSPAFFTNHQLPHTEAYNAQLISASNTASVPAPSGQYKGWINAFISGLIGDNNWYPLDRLWLFATEQQVHAYISLINPNGLNNAPWPTNVSSVNNPAWASGEGFTGDLTGMRYLSTGYSPSSSAVNLQMDNMSIGVYCRSGSLPAIGQYYGTMGTDGSGGQRLLGFLNGNQNYSVYYLENQGSGAAYTITTPVGLLWATKQPTTPSGTAILHANYNQYTSAPWTRTDIPGGLDTSTVTILYSFGFYSPLQISLAFIGAKVSISFNTRVQALATAIGF